MGLFSVCSMACVWTGYCWRTCLWKQKSKTPPLALCQVKMGLVIKPQMVDGWFLNKSWQRRTMKMRHVYLQSEEFYSKFQACRCLCMQRDNVTPADNFCMFRANAGRGCGAFNSPQVQHFASLGCSSLPGCNFTSDVTVGDGQLSAVWRRYSGRRVSLIWTCWSQSRQYILWRCRTAVWGILKMAKNPDDQFGAPFVTKAHWRKPSHVSSFTAEIYWMANITRWHWRAFSAEAWTASPSWD